MKSGIEPRKRSEAKRSGSLRVEKATAQDGAGLKANLGLISERVLKRFEDVRIKALSEYRALMVNWGVREPKKKT